MSELTNGDLIGAVVVTTYSRTDLLKKSLESIINAKGRENIHLVVVLQKGNFDTEAIIEGFNQQIDTLITVDGSSRSVIENINFNRALAYDYCFVSLKSPWVLGIEDDTQISSDAIIFSDFIMTKYSKNRHFRICNLGSKSASSQVNEYSVFRWGIIGQGSTINAKTWFKIKNSKRFKELKYIPLDGIMEHYLKTGFSVFPNRSRIKDEGWDGTHSKSNSEDSHFKEIRESFVEFPEISDSYSLNQIKPNWRHDQIIYSLTSNPYYILKNLILSSNYSATALNIKKFSRDFLNSFKK